MRFEVKFLVFLGALSAVAITLAVCDAKVGDFEFSLADCKKIMARIAKRTVKAFGQCSRELKANVTGDKEMFQKKIGVNIIFYKYM